MNIKKVLVLSLFAIVLIVILAPVNAKLDSNLETYSLKEFNGKTNLILQVYSDIGMKNKDYYLSKYSSKRKTELNKVNKVNVKINGYKTVTFKKPIKGWKSDYYAYSFDMSFLIKGKSKNIANRDCSIEIYDKNKLIKTKKGKVLFSEWTSGTGINNNPKLYFDKMKTQKKKNSLFGNFRQTNKRSYWDVKDPILNISSGVDYYYDKNSNFKKPITTKYTYNSYFHYKTGKMEKKKMYTNGKYTLTIFTEKGSKGVTKFFSLDKVVYETSYKSVKNPYFTVSKECDWTNPTVINLASAIKSTVTRSNYANDDLYNTAVANAVIRYLHTNIKYDKSFSDQSAITTLQRESGSCVGNSMLAGALLRVLGIPAHFQSSWNKTKGALGHTWIVAYIFHENSYRWVPAETTYYFADDLYGNSQWYTDELGIRREFDYSFQTNAIDWWIIGKDGKYDFMKGYGAYNA